MMKEAISQVYEWQSFFGRNNGKEDHTIPDRMKTVNQATAQARVDFIIEELEEYLEANKKGDIVGVLDAIIDILYFTFGMVVIHGLQNVTSEGFDIVHRCNMSKLWPGNIVRTSPNGKVLKPHTFKKPEKELEELIRNEQTTD